MFTQWRFSRLTFIFNFLDYFSLSLVSVCIEIRETFPSISLMLVAMMLISKLIWHRKKYELSRFLNELMHVYSLMCLFSLVLWIIIFFVYIKMKYYQTIFAWHRSFYYFNKNIYFHRLVTWQLCHKAESFSIEILLESKRRKFSFIKQTCSV